MQAIRRGASWIQVAAAVLVVVGVFAQVYLIGAYFFGAGSDALNAHKDVGGIVHGLEVLTLLAALVAWLPRTDLILSLVLALVGTGQIALAEADKWAGGLHPLFALVVLALAGSIAQRGIRRQRTPAAASAA